MRDNTTTAFVQILPRSINLTVASSVDLFKLRVGEDMVLALYKFMTLCTSLTNIPWRPSSLANDNGSSIERLTVELRLDATMFGTNLSTPLLCLTY